MIADNEEQRLSCRHRCFLGDYCGLELASLNFVVGTLKLESNSWIRWPVVSPASTAPSQQMLSRQMSD